MSFSVTISQITGSYIKALVSIPPTNGVLERKNHHLVEVPRAFMFTMNLPKYLWGMLYSLLPIFETPLSMLTAAYPMFSTSQSLSLKIFGCTTFVHVHQHGKLDPHALETVLFFYLKTLLLPSHKEKPIYHVMTHSLRALPTSLPLCFEGNLESSSLGCFPNS